MKHRRGPSVALLLIGVNSFVLALPLLGLAMWRVYDVYLLRQTERQLIAQAVVIGEIFRREWRLEHGVEADQHRPPGRVDDRYVPIDPQIDIDSRIGQPDSLEDLPVSPAADTPERRAGERIEALLLRAQTFNLSGVRVLDGDGCVVATTGGQAGRCLGSLPEVGRALAGRYASQARYRAPVEPRPALGAISRRGQVRVFVALPIFSNERVIGVVTVSRTGLDALSSLWQIRRGLVLAGAVVLLAMLGVSLLFARAISGPMRAITERARAIAQGESPVSLASGGWTPKEIQVLSEALDTMTRKLDARARYVSDFATTVSHELKTPIAAVRGAAELLRDDWQQMEPEQRAPFVGDIELDAARMERLVSRLLTLARVESAADEQAAAIEVVPLCRDLVESRGDGVVLVVEDPPECVRIPEEWLVIVVTNLVDNAQRHGGEAPVTVTLGERAGRLQIHGCTRTACRFPSRSPRVSSRSKCGPLERDSPRARSKPS